MSSLEAAYIVKLGDVVTEMQLPTTVENGTTLPVNLKYAEVTSPPTIEQPITVPVSYQHHWWESESKPVRVGPSEEHWDLRFLWRRDKPMMHFVLRDDLRSVPAVSSIYKDDPDHSWFKKGAQIEYLKPGTVGNPTKNTPAYVKLEDSGRARIYQSSDVFVKFDLMMKSLRGHFVAVRRDPHLDQWTIQKEEASPKTRGGS